MIPRTIHYCWFGKAPMPELAQRCIASWEKYFPGYKIQRWDETNYDVTAIPYVREAYQAEKWAFVSDYARFDILYRYGGLYFDTDVEIIAPLDDVLAEGPFMGLQRTVLPADGKEVFWPAPGLGLAAHAGMEIYREMLELYQGLHFIREDGRLNMNTVPMYTWMVMQRHGFDQSRNAIQRTADVLVYPTDYFSPIDYFSGKLIVTGNTRSVHHFSASWMSSQEKKVESLDRLLRGKSRTVKWIIYCGTLPVRLIYILQMEGFSGVIRRIRTKVRSQFSADT